MIKMHFKIYLDKSEKSCRVFFPESFVELEHRWNFLVTGRCGIMIIENTTR